MVYKMGFTYAHIKLIKKYKLEIEKLKKKIKILWTWSEYPGKFDVLHKFDELIAISSIML